MWMRTWRENSASRVILPASPVEVAVAARQLRPTVRTQLQRRHFLLAHLAFEVFTERRLTESASAQEGLEQSLEDLRHGSLVVDVRRPHATRIRVALRLVARAILGRR